MPTATETTEARDDVRHEAGRPQPLVRAEWVANVGDIALPTVYEMSRRDPARWGRVTIGRAVRFRRDAIERLFGLVN